jgi:hypothetical protein
MKKLLIVLLALTVVGIFAFADDAAAPAAPKAIGTFGSWNTGSVSLYKQVGSNTAQTGWNNQWGAPAGIDQEWGFGYAGNNFGYTSRFCFESDTLQAPGLASFDTYYNFSKAIQIAIGKPRGGEYRTLGTLVDNQQGAFFCNAKPGVELNVTPIDGLSASAFLTTGGTWADANVAYADNLAFGAQYSMAGLFTVNGMYQGKNVNGTASYISASASVTPIKDLTVNVNGQFPNGGNSTFSVSAGYVLDALTVQGDFTYQTTSNSLATEENVAYALGTYAVGARFGYEDGKGNGLYGDGMSDIYTSATAGHGVLIYPYVKANFDNGSFIQLGVAYQTGANNAAAKLDVPLYYGWSF